MSKCKRKYMNKSNDKLSNAKKQSKKNDEDKKNKIEDKRICKIKLESRLTMHSRKHRGTSNER